MRLKDVPKNRVECERKGDMRLNLNLKAVSGSLAACATLITIVAVLHAQPAAGAQPPAAADPAVITAWNATAVSTITGTAPNGAGKANVEAFLWFAYSRQPSTTQ